MAFAPIPESVERAGKVALDCCFRVHTKLGPGLLESVYEDCLCYELEKSGVPFGRQVGLAVVYEELQIANGFYIDVLVDNAVVLELKSVESIHRTHESQLLTYMRLAEKRLGFLINFNEAHLKNGIRRRVI